MREVISLEIANPRKAENCPAEISSFATPSSIVTEFSDVHDMNNPELVFSSDEGILADFKITISFSFREILLIIW